MTLYRILSYFSPASKTLVGRMDLDRRFGTFTLLRQSLKFPALSVNVPKILAEAQARMFHCQRE